MRRVVAYELVSLDGVAESPEQFFTVFDDVMRANLGRVIATQDCVLLGRRTYDDWAAYWPSSTSEPFSTFINGVEKFVFTSTSPSVVWANSFVVEKDLVNFITELRERPGGDIGVHGSIVLTQSLLEHKLIHELRLVVAPAVQIQGRRLFERGTPAGLTLTRHIASPSGYLLLDFKIGG